VPVQTFIHNEETNMQIRPWIKSYGTIPATVSVDTQATLIDLVDRATAEFGEKIAFCSVGQKLSYAALDTRSRQFCAYLQNELGVQKGDRVAVMVPNLAAFPIAMLGILRAGAVQVNVNPLYTPRELEYQLNDAGCKVMVIFSGSTPTLAEVIGNTPVKHVVVSGVGDGLGVEIPSPPVDARLTQTTSVAKAIELGSGLQVKPVALAGSDLVFLQYTGGTTGLSKGAALSHHNLLSNIAQFQAFMPSALLPAQEVMVTAIPLYHIFALMVSLVYLSVGAENWLVPNPRDMDSFLATLKAARPTIFPAVNTLFAGLTQHPRIGDVDWSRLKLAIGGGAAVIGVVSDRWKAITGQFIREGYGLSETSPAVSFNPAYIDQFSGTTGLPMPSTDIKLLDDDGREVALGEAGEICVKGPQVMSGYWEKPEANASAFTADGYFRTGDVGVFDERGFLKIVDRKKDMIIVSGFNVYPNDVEAGAASCPGVLECACVGVPDEKSGEAVRLFVVKAPDSELTADMVIAHCRTVLTGYKIPRIVSFVPALPKSTVGKILRRELRDVA
jgi:long-chain acyl-CoA synthetase